MSIKMKAIICGLCFFSMHISCQNANPPIKTSISDSDNPVTVPLEGHFCYSDTIGDACITVRLDLHQHQVKGHLLLQSNTFPPEQGELQGSITTGGDLRLLHQYVVEHHPVSEHLLMKWYPHYLLIKRGELITINGISTYKDESAATYDDTLRVIDCGE